MQTIMKKGPIEYVATLRAMEFILRNKAMKTETKAMVTNKKDCFKENLNSLGDIWTELRNVGIIIDIITNNTFNPDYAKAVDFLYQLIDKYKRMNYTKTVTVLEEILSKYLIIDKM